MTIQAAGITAEYNPFHNGHLWQLRELRRRLGDVPVIVCMSGWFVQRGEAALADPLIRAEMAIRNGADLVFLLPSWYSLHSADYFAGGSVRLLAATGLVHTLVCGVEHTAAASAPDQETQPLPPSVKEQGHTSGPPSTDPGLSLAEISLRDTAAWSLEKNTEQQVRDLLKQGLSYGAAWETAAADNGKDAGWFAGANNILALAYQKTIFQNRFPMTLLPLPRKGSSHNETQLDSRFASASAIRKALRSDTPLSSLSGVMPKPAIDLLKKEKTAENFPLHAALQEKLLSSLLSYYLIHNSSRDIREHSSASPDLCDRFFNTRQALQYGYASFCLQAANKRDSLPAVRRLSLQLLLQKPRSFWTEPPEPSYLRVLAFNDRGRFLLKEMKHTASLPVITKMGNEGLYAGTDLYPLLQLDAEAADLFCQLQGNAGTYGTGFTASPVYVEG